MSRTSLEQEIIDELSRLDSAGQLHVQEFIKSLPKTPEVGEPGQGLLALIGAIPPEDLQEMSQAVEESCEKVDPDGWAITS